MTKVDEVIKALGYEKKESNMPYKYAVYENNSTDTRVEIEWDDDDEDCKIFPQTISMYRDWYGHLNHEPGCLNIEEMTAFVAKIQELRG